MDRRLVLVIIGIAVAIVAAVVAVMVFASPTAPGAGPTSGPPAAEDAPAPGASTPSDTAPSDSAGVYVDYSDDAIAQAEGRVLLFFHAPWCPQCRSVESDILAAGVPAGVTIIKVDYDSRQDLRQQYGVTLQTTFVEVDADGSEVQKHVAYDNPHLDAVIAAML